MMRFSLRALTPVKLISPGRKSRALLSKFMKNLADEYGPGKSAMNPKRFAAAFEYRSDTRIKRGSAFTGRTVRIRLGGQPAMGVSAWQTGMRHDLYIKLLLGCRFRSIEDRVILA